MSTYEVQDNSSSGVGHILQILKHFFPYAQKQLGFHKPVMISFQSDEENANKLLGKTGYYNPDDFSIAIYVDRRHPKDVLRSLSHELVHHTQNCNGDFDSTKNLGLGYAQEDGPMRAAELDAYKRGNIIFRDFEDLIKKGKIKVNINFEETGEPKMSLKEWRNQELNQLLMEKWGLAEKRFANDPKLDKDGDGVPKWADKDDDDDELDEANEPGASGGITGMPSRRGIEDEDKLNEFPDFSGVTNGWRKEDEDEDEVSEQMYGNIQQAQPQRHRDEDDDDDNLEEITATSGSVSRKDDDDEDKLEEREGEEWRKEDDEDEDKLEEFASLGSDQRSEDDEGWGKSPAAFTGTRKREKKAAAALKKGKGLEERSRTQETITLDEARDLARRIFERLTKERK